jgi:hypothetical protein
LEGWKGFQEESATLKLWSADAHLRERVAETPTKRHEATARARMGLDVFRSLPERMLLRAGAEIHALGVLNAMAVEQAKAASRPQPSWPSPGAATRPPPRAPTSTPQP